MDENKVLRSSWWKPGLAVVIVAAIVAIIVIKQGYQRESAVSEGSGQSVAATDRAALPPESAGLPRMVDLGAESCIPCKKMAPILAQLKDEMKGVAQIKFIDVWKNPNAGQEYNIRLIPTQVFYTAEGREVFRHEGFFSRQAILEQFAKMGVDISGMKKE